MNQRELEGMKKAMGPEHPDTLMGVNNLAVALQYQGMYEAAEQMHRQVLEGRRRLALSTRPGYTNERQSYHSAVAAPGRARSGRWPSGYADKRQQLYRSDPADLHYHASLQMIAHSLWT
jgi:hypothetical protein